MKFFDHDAPFFRLLSLLADVAILSFLWLLTSLPVITIGATTSAAYYVMTRRISDMENRISVDFFTAFKRNFKRSTVIFLLLVFFSILNLFNLLAISVPGTLGIVINIFQVFLAFEFLFTFIYVFPLASRFEMNIKQLVKSAIIMSNRHFLYTLAHVIILTVLIVITYILPVMFFFGFGIYCWLSSYLFIRLWRKYRPEMDVNADLEEEKQQSKKD